MDRFFKLVEDNKGFEIVHAYRDDIDHYIGGKNDHYWYCITSNGRIKEGYAAIYRDGKWRDQYIKGEGKNRKVKDIESGTTIDRICSAAFLAQEESWVKDKKGSLIETDHPYYHFVKGFGDKALDVSKDYGVTIGYNDLENNEWSFHLRDLNTSDDAEIFE